MNQIKIFENSEFGSVRTVEDNGKILFCGSDVAKALGYANSRKALNDHCRCVTNRYIPHPQSPEKQIAMNFISESDIYRLIVNSKLPSAAKFEKWVFDEVLPTIRQTGAYMTPETIEKVLCNPDTVINLATQIKNLQFEIAKKNQIIGELKPKANYVDIILNNPGLITVTQLAKDYGMSGQKMNELLHKAGVQYKQSGQWLLYSKYHNFGYTHSCTIDITRADGRKDVTLQTKWTTKGRLFIYELLKSMGIYPAIEKLTTA